MMKARQKKSKTRKRSYVAENWSNNARALDNIASIQEIKHI